MKNPRRFSLAALALLLTACLPSFDLQVNLPEPTAFGFSVALAADATSGNAPLAVMFSADVRERASYTWYVNDRKLPGRRSTLAYTFTEVGRYEVTVAATNAVGEADTDTVTVEVTDAGSDETTVETL